MPASARTPRIPVIGIVGGIGSGKSSVAKWVAGATNVEVLDADLMGHEALRDNGVKQALCQRFGTSILRPDGEIDRSAVAKLVFGPNQTHREARHALEQVVHPEIGRRIAQGIEAAAAKGRMAVLLDAAILLEAGWRKHCDAVVFVDCPDNTRLARLRADRGWDEEEMRRRESSQWGLTEKRRCADLVITNSGELELVGTQLLRLLEEQGFVNQGA